MLGGVGFLGVLWLGDGSKLPHQAEQVHLEPVLGHLAVHHAVDLDAREGHSLVSGRDPLELAAVVPRKATRAATMSSPEKMSSTVSRKSGNASTKAAVNCDQASKSSGPGSPGAWAM